MLFSSRINVKEMSLKLQLLTGKEITDTFPTNMIFHLLCALEIRLSLSLLHSMNSVLNKIPPVCTQHELLI